MLTAPIAKKIPTLLSKHDDVRTDDYYWLRERENPDTIAYLNAENAYKDTLLAPTKDLQATLFQEIVGRIQQTDMSVPNFHNGYLYYTRFEEGKEYPIHCRKKDNSEGEEQILLNVNLLAEGQTYCEVNTFSVSPDNKWLAYGLDTVSRRQYKIFFKNLLTGKTLDYCIENTSGKATWANDSQTVFFTRKDKTLRSYKVFKMTLTPDAKPKEKVVFHEKDETFSCFVYKTKSERYLVIGSAATLSAEYKVLDADKPNNSRWKTILPREDKHEYSIDHYGNDFYILTNWQARNFRLMKTSVRKTDDKSQWKEVIAHREAVLLEGMQLFKDYLVLSERVEGITKIRVQTWKGTHDHHIQFNDAAYCAYPAVNMEFDTPVLRLGYTSMTTPATTYDYDMVTRTLTLLKQQTVVGDFKADDYHSERLMATVRDGVQVPISLVYKKGMVKDGNAPLLLYAYGSYGYSMEPSFSSVRLSLLDRGWVFAIAHIRGGQEMGRFWYDDGKFFKKKNTFHDFIDCAEYLISQQFTSSENLYAQGGSAGGLLMGAVANLRPDLWKGVIAQVPFVDVVTTMLDETIPLTTGEYDEWGNPNQKDYYEYMKSYSPYDNVEAKAYPSMLVTTGLHDSQVQYWEPAKWVAKLRDLKTDQNPLLLYTNMDTGHGGASGRFERYKEVAMEYAFLEWVRNRQS